MMHRRDDKYLRLLAKEYTTTESVAREIINLNAILNLPKGTEHFMSDLHGEYEAFLHILNNCSGVIREKAQMLFSSSLTPNEIQELCTLIYYPAKKLKLMEAHGPIPDQWYRMVLNQLIEIAKLLSSKYTRSKVRKAMEPEFAYILDELIHAQKDEDDNQVQYHAKIIDTILELKTADEFLIALSALIKRLAVDHLHIVGDIYDRGPDADKILDLLMKHHSLDIEWGNHDILWMGAACGNRACVATAVRHCLKYDSVDMLESSYGISLRELTLFAGETYKDLPPMEAAIKAITVMVFKLEAQLIEKYPEFEMSDRLILKNADIENGTVEIDGTTYQLKTTDFPTVIKGRESELSEGEELVIRKLTSAFKHSKRLREHVRFLYEKGCMYKVFNGNLIFHGCIPMTEEGNLRAVEVEGRRYMGRSYMEKVEELARRAFSDRHDEVAVDYMWYMWAGRYSPLCGRTLKTFEMYMIEDEASHKEPTNAYYTYYVEEKYCDMILHDFGLYNENAHIINGHTPVKTTRGEHPVRANGKLLVIDGGFSKSYHKKTGIAGYTLIFNSHGLRIKAHKPFSSVDEVLENNLDIESDSQIVEEEKLRMMVRDSDIGTRIRGEIEDLMQLLEVYREGGFQ